ncbi:MAG: hypothetical protein U0228_30580 [Myxococcaceae bacterium]
MPTLLAASEADLPFVQGVAEQLRTLFGVACESGVLTDAAPGDALVLERHGSTRRRKRNAFLTESRFCALGPLAVRPFKFKLQVSSTTDDERGDEAALRISLAGQLLPFFAPSLRAMPVREHVTVVDAECGTEFAEELAEALRFERFDAEVRATPPAEGHWLAPAKPGARVPRTTARISGHEEQWPGAKASDPQRLGDALAEKFRERVAALKKKG